MITKGNMVTLNKEEINQLIDKECRKRLGISAREYLRKRKNGGLAKSIATHDIEILLKLA